MPSSKSETSLQGFVFLITVILLVSSSLSCRQISKQAARKVGVYIATTLLIVAVEELAAEGLTKELSVSTADKEPINITIHNNFEQEVKVDLTQDGVYWEARLIEPKKKTNFSSTKKGKVGAKTADSYYMLRKTQEYQVIQKQGKFVIEEVKVNN